MLIPCKKVLVWFQNSQQRKSGDKSKKAKKTKPALDGRSALTWTLRKVVKEKKSDEVDALVLEKDPAATRGTEGYLTHLQHCITTVIEGLTEEETMEFEDLADQWNAKGVDPDIQARWVQPSSLYFIHMLNWRRQADKHMAKFAKDFMETAYKQMGVHVFMLLGWENSEGALVRTKYACNLCLVFQISHLLSGWKWTHPYQSRSSTQAYSIHLAKRHGINMMTFCRPLLSMVR